MFRVLFAEYGMLSRYVPINAKTIVKDADTAVRFWMVKIIAFILEYGSLAQYGETVSEAFRDEELPVVILGQFHCHMLAVGRRAFAYVNGYIKHFPLYALHQFGLCERRTLEMQTAHHAV